MENIWMYVIIAVAVVFVLVIFLCLSIANFSFDNFRAKQEEARAVGCSTFVNTRAFVEEINENILKAPLKVELCEEYQEHFSPGVIALSPNTMASNSLASLAIVAHEMGHAIQFEEGKLTKHWQSRRRDRIIGKFFVPIALIGIVLSLLGVFEVLETYFLYIGIGFVGLALLIFLEEIYAKYREVKVEREASDNGIKILSQYISQSEVKICREFLNSARLTYWGGLFRVMFSWTMLTKKER